MFKTLLAVLALACPLAAAAAPSDDAPSRWSLGVALGYGLRSNPLIQSEDIPILVDLDIAWFGDRLFFDNGDLGWTFADNPWFTLSGIARMNSDRVFFGRTNNRIVQVGVSQSDGSTTFVDVVVDVPDRDYALEAGFELLADGAWGRLQVAGFKDVAATHGGHQFSVDYSYGIRQQRWYLEPSIGISVKSSALNDYYWGVRDAEAGPALPAYRAGSDTNVSFRLLGSYQLTRHWAMTVVAEMERLGDEVTASPLVRDDNVTGFFAGFGYRF